MLRPLALLTALLAYAFPLLAQDQPHGEHYNLNLIAKSKAMTPDSGEVSDSGHVIFVSLGTDSAAVTTKINLSQSATGSFLVLDKNGTDGTASFQLPAVGTYTVWARPLGKPGGGMDLSTCGIATDTLGGTSEECSLESAVFVRGVKGKGKSPKNSFRNVTGSLTTIHLDAVADSALVASCGGESVALFSPCLSDYFWKASNSGLRLLQLRFYPVQ